MKTVTIPNCMNPYVVTINNNSYNYPAGETVEVPDEVAAVIEAQGDLKPIPRKIVTSKVNLKIDAGSRTVECDMPISDLLLRVEKEGYDCVNINLYMYGNPLAFHKVSGSLPDLLRVHYMYLASTDDTPSISLDNVSVKKDGTLSFAHEATIVSG